MRCLRKNVYLYVLSVLLLIAGLILFDVRDASAQLSSQTFSFAPQVGIDVEPEYPREHEAIKLSLNAYSIDTAAASIRWYINGVEDTDAKGSLEYFTVTGDVGEKMDVQVIITTSAGNITRVNKTITPTEIDFVVEADTTIPSFYDGRALPGPGAAIRVTAIPHLGTSAEGSDTLRYTWKENNNVLFGGPTLNKKTINIELHSVSQTRLTLQISDRNGKLLTEKSFVVRSTQPVVYFYEQNPLRGVARISTGPEYIMTGEEFTVRAEPYYVNRNVFAQGVSVYAWEVDGRRIDNSDGPPQQLTLRAVEGSGSAEVLFFLNNLEDVLQTVRNEFTVNFSALGS